MPTNPISLSPAELLRILREHPRRWLVPTLVVALLAAAYAVVRPDTWEATQTMYVRNEAAGNLADPGKFRHADEMKSAQETILEIARSQGVLATALAQVGPPSDYSDPTVWPTALDVATVSEQIKLAPPKGAEFGKTEVIYLKAQDREPGRALALVDAVYRQLQARIQNLRDTKAQSMIDELTKAVDIAEEDLRAATSRLTAIEQSAGGDLAELRMLHESAAGDSHLRHTALELETELRQAQLAERNLHNLYELLTASLADPGRLLATPSRLLESQPALKRLKEGLVDAQLRTAELTGKMSDRHPSVVAARESEQQISRQLHGELNMALRGIEADLKLSAERVAALGERLTAAQKRLERLAGMRAEYSNLVSEVENRGRLLETAQKELAEARGSQAGAHSASLISCIDAAQISPRPIGPSRALIVAVGLFGGLAVGVGVLFLSIQPSPQVEPATHAPTSPFGSQRGVNERRKSDFAGEAGIFLGQALLNPR